VAVTRKAAEALSTLRTRARLELGDKSTSTAQQKFSNTEINQALNDALCFFQRMMSGVQPAYALVATTVTYTAAADSTALTGDLLVQPIFQVFDIDNTDVPLEIPYVEPTQLERHRYSGGLWPSLPQQVYSLLATATSRSIAIRPVPSASRSLRVWHIAAPFVAGDDADTSPLLSPDWSELVALHAARALASIEDEFTAQQERRYEQALAEFTKWGQRQHRGTHWLPRRRRGRS